MYGRALQTDQAVKFFGDKFGEGASARPNGRTYRILSEMYIRSGEMEKALSIKDEMMQTVDEPDVEVFGNLVRKLSGQKRVQEALALMDEAQAAGLKPRERNIRELRRLCDVAGIEQHPLVGTDPEQWRKDANVAKRSKRKKDNQVAYRMRMMMTNCFS